MVIVVLSAMAGASKLLNPYMNNAVDQNIAERYKEISRYLLLNTGTPSNWGQNGQTIPATFGLAKAGSDSPYELDVDKVSRLNSENQYAVSYADIFTSLGLFDVSFRIEIKPIFEVVINLTATFVFANETVYQLEIRTEKNGASIQTLLKCYFVAQNYLNTTDVFASAGKTYQNVTILNSVTGPVLLVVFARHVYDARMISFTAYAFAHNSAEPQSAGTFLRFSPLNYALNASFLYSEVNLSRAYALTFDYNSTLTEATNTNESAIYEIPRFLDSSPTLIALTGSNSSSFFVEWVAYPQVPLRFGADFANSVSLSSVLAYTYAVSINSAIYECRVWLGGPKQ
jgi:hypothetical protein